MRQDYRVVSLRTTVHQLHLASRVTRQSAATMA